MNDMERIALLEQRVGHVERELETLKDTLKDIKSDTAELVDLLKGGKVFARVVSWIVTLAAGAGGIYAMWWKK